MTITSKMARRFKTNYGADKIDESVIGNFMSARFNKQAHLGGFAGAIDPKLEFKPSLRLKVPAVLGGLSLITGIRSVLRNR